MDSEDRLTDRPLHPPSDHRLTDLPPSPPGLPPPLPGLFAPVTIRVVAFALLVYFFWPILAMAVLAAAGWVPRPSPVEGASVVGLLGSPLGQGALAAASAAFARKILEMQALMRVELLAGALAFPPQVASIVLFLPRLTGVRLERVGLTFREFGRNCLRGAAGWLVLTPVCFAVNYGIILLYGSSAATNVQEHMFEQMAAQGLPALEWFLLIFTATVAAPFLEEVVFRGALQPWLEARPWAPHAVMGLAVLTAAYYALPDAGATLLRLTPILFFLGLCVVYLAVWRLSRTPAAPAVFASSAMFAAVHSAWPQPVALFVLALGLGWLARRTRSLVGPIVLHGLFNAVSCVLLLVPQ